MSLSLPLSLLFDHLFCCCICLCVSFYRLPHICLFVPLNFLPALYRAVRRRHCVGGGAPVNFGRRRRRDAGPKKTADAAARRGVGGQKQIFLRFTKNFVLSSKCSEGLF